MDLITNYFKYNQDTGDFIRTLPIGRAKAGEKAGCISKNGYVYIPFMGKQYLAHRLAFIFMGRELPKEDVDHIDGVRSNNTWSNLRLVNRSQNLMNRVPNKGRQHKNVYWCVHANSYRVKMKIDGVTRHFGYFKTLEEAAEKAISVRKEFHGEYARHI